MVLSRPAQIEGFVVGEYAVELGLDTFTSVLVRKEWSRRHPMGNPREGDRGRFIGALEREPVEFGRHVGEVEFETGRFADRTTDTWPRDAGGIGVSIPTITQRMERAVP